MRLHYFGHNLHEIRRQMERKDVLNVEARKRVSLRYRHISFVSPKAILVEFYKRSVWIPKTFITIDSERRIINMPTWLMNDKSLQKYLLSRRRLRGYERILK